MVMVDAISRLVPGVLGHKESASDETFSSKDYVEYPQYTRPENYKGKKVPPVLLSGDHARIKAWRKKQAKKR
jgi:tRNA (guanine37-N1)-methyltransferase